MPGGTQATNEQESGLSRRSLLKRSAIVGGALVWTAPAVQTIAAPAYATGSQPPTPGEVSYAIVFFKSEGLYYRAKYVGAAEGYTEACGDGATRGQVSNDEAGVGRALYDRILTELGSPTFQTACPPGVSYGVEPDTGNLLVTLSGATQIIAWLLHDGSCRQSDPETAFRYDAPRTEQDPQTSGPEVPTALGGTFVFDDCN